MERPEPAQWPSWRPRRCLHACLPAGTLALYWPSPPSPPPPPPPRRACTLLHVGTEQERTCVKGEAARALEAARRLAQLDEARTRAGGSLAAAVKLLEAEQGPRRPGAPDAPQSVRAVYLAWWGGWLRGERLPEGERQGAARASVYGAPPPASGSMPLRFADVTTRRHRTKGEHPVYLTSSGDYGRQGPSQLDMPNVYASSSQVRLLLGSQQAAQRAHRLRQRHAITAQMHAC